MIRFNCPKCGREFKSEPQYAGKRFNCRSCDAEIRIPSSPTKPSPAFVPSQHQPTPRKSPSIQTLGSDNESELLNFNCPGCEKPYQFKAELAGGQFTCFDCGTECRIPVSQSRLQLPVIAIADSVPPKVTPMALPIAKLAKASTNPQLQPTDEPLASPDELPTFEADDTDQHQTAAGIYNRESEELVSSNRCPPLPLPVSKGGIMLKDVTAPPIKVTFITICGGLLIVFAIGASGLWAVFSAGSFVVNKVSDFLRPTAQELDQQAQKEWEREFQKSPEWKQRQEEYRKYMRDNGMGHLVD